MVCCIRQPIKHNQKVLALFAEWGRNQIQLRSFEAWERGKDKVQLPKGLERVSLWIDSTDIGLHANATATRKSLDWSYKDNRPAQRYMALTGALGRVVHL